VTGGARVTLISTVGLAEPPGIEITYVETALQMKEAVQKAVVDADVLVMAAAVSRLLSPGSGPVQD